MSLKYNLPFAHIRLRSSCEKLRQVFIKQFLPVERQPGGALCEEQDRGRPGCGRLNGKKNREVLRRRADAKDHPVKTGNIWRRGGQEHRSGKLADQAVSQMERRGKMSGMGKMLRAVDACLQLGRVVMMKGSAEKRWQQNGQQQKPLNLPFPFHYPIRRCSFFSLGTKSTPSFR